jgi:hypothetical protein
LGRLVLLCQGNQLGRSQDVGGVSVVIVITAEKGCLPMEFCARFTENTPTGAVTTRIAGDPGEESEQIARYIFKMRHTA